MKSDDKDKRREYEKPELRSIDLAADEVMAVGCKTVSRTGPLKVTPPCAPCQNIGS